jgi:hypothetical protein
MYMTACEPSRRRGFTVSPPIKKIEERKIIKK